MDPARPRLIQRTFNYTLLLAFTYEMQLHHNTLSYIVTVFYRVVQKSETTLIAHV